MSRAYLFAAGIGSRLHPRTRTLPVAVDRRVCPACSVLTIKSAGQF